MVSDYRATRPEDKDNKIADLVSAEGATVAVKQLSIQANPTQELLLSYSSRMILCLSPGLCVMARILRR